MIHQPASRHLLAALALAACLLVVLAAVPSRGMSTGAPAQSAVKVPTLTPEQLEHAERARLYGTLVNGTYYHVPGGWPQEDPDRQVAGRPWWNFGNPPSFMMSVGGHRYRIFYYGAPHPTDPDLVCLTSVQEIEVSGHEWDYEVDPPVWRMYNAEIKGATPFAGC